MDPSPPPRSPVLLKRNDVRSGTLKLPTSVSRRASPVRPSTQDSSTVPFTQSVESKTQRLGFVRDGRFIHLGSDISSRVSLNSTGSNSLHVSGKPTRDSMVENMLLSFNKIPGGQAFDRSYPPSSYTRVVTDPGNATLRNDSSQPVSPQTPMDRKSPESVNEIRRRQKSALSLSLAASRDGLEQTPSGSLAASVSKHSRSPSTGDYTLYEAEQGSRGKASQARGGQIRRARNHSTSLDATIRDTPMSRQAMESTGYGKRPATAPYSNSDAAPYPTVSPGLRKLHSPPRHVKPVQLTSSSIALAAAAAAATAQVPSVRVHPSLPKASETPEEENRSIETPESDLLPELPQTSPSVRTTSDRSGRKPSTTRSASDRSLSRLDSQSSSVDSRALKQRSSFFRRVFGPSRTHSGSNTNQIMPTQSEESPQLPPKLPPLNVTTRSPERHRARMNPNQYAGQLLYLPNPPTPSPPKESLDPLHKLNKKPSFFRRRRKDTSDNDLGPTADDMETLSVLTSTSRAASSTAEPSPSISSLRRVMNPYLSVTTSRTTSPHDLSTNYQFVRKSTDIIAEEKGVDDHVPAVTMLAGGIPSRNEMPRPSTSTVADSVDSVTMKRAYEGEYENLYVIDGSPIIRNDSVSLEEVAPTRNESPKRQRTHWTKIQADDELSEALDFSNVPNLHSTSIDVLGLRPLNDTTVSPVEDELTSPEDDGWIVTTPHKNTDPEVLVSKTHRIWLKASASEELLSSDKWSLPLPDPQRRPAPSPSNSMGPDEIFVTPAPSSRPRTTESTIRGSDVSSLTYVTDPTELDYQRAQKIYDGGVVGFDHDQAAISLGEAGLAADRLRRAYMSFYDFAGTNVLLGLTELCGKLALKGETQQVDRILLAFSQRWTECNPEHGFRTTDVIHTLCYSILLLNTDLHVADLEQKMTRGQFVKNTLFAITRSIEDASIDVISTSRNASKSTTPLREDPPPLTKSPLLVSDSFIRRPSFEMRNSEGRLATLSSMRPISTVRSNSSPTPYDIRPVEPCDLLMGVPFLGSNKAWEGQLEALLKDFYTSIRLQRLPLFGSGNLPEGNNTAAYAWLRRSGSTVSKAPAESLRGFAPNFSSVGSRWNSKNKSRTKVYSSSTLTSSRGTSRTSLDDPSFYSSPASTWSKSNHGRPPAAASTDSLGTNLGPGDFGFQQSVGFANALSHAIIREEIMSESESDGPIEQLFEEEELGLAGAPWAKEGIVQHKHHLEETDKKYKDRNWSECFAVVEKGWMHLFSFNSKASVRNQKNRSIRQGSVVGGGNWTENAEAVDSFMLRQTIANLLPSPGYSKIRPHVFALSLPNGAVHLFQVGTHEIALEFVATANYWSARLSKEPLMGGISNVEYGWGDSVISSAFVTSADNDKPTTSKQKPKGAQTNNTSYPPSAHNPTATSSRPSIQGSIRNSLDGGRPRLVGDRVQLNDWTLPQQSMMASALNEDEQLDALRAYVGGVEEELGRHNELRPAMLLVFSNRQPNAVKAMNNWERKSSYLLKEIVKFRTYIDSLTEARAEKLRLLAERNQANIVAKRVGGVARGSIHALTTASSTTSATTTPTPTTGSSRGQEELARLAGLSLQEVDGGRAM